MRLGLPSPRNNRRGSTRISNRIPRGSKYNRSKSSSYESVYDTRNGKEFRKLTPKGKYVRNKVELENGANVYTGEVLTDYQRGKRAGYNQALGEQANFYNGKRRR